MITFFDPLDDCYGKIKKMASSTAYAKFGLEFVIHDGKLKDVRIFEHHVHLMDEKKNEQVPRTRVILRRKTI